MSQNRKNGKLGSERNVPKWMFLDYGIKDSKQWTFFEWSLRGTFFLFSFIVLAFVYEEVLLQYFWSDYFSEEEWFCHTLLTQVGGCMIYAARWLNQVFRHPQVAGFLLAVALTLIQWWISSLFCRKKRGSWLLLSYIPSFVLLFYWIHLRYTIYYSFEHAYILTPILVLTWTLGVFTLLRFLSKKIDNDLLILIGTAVLSVSLYPFLGVTTLFPLLLFAVEAKKKLVWTVFGLLLFFLLPLVPFFTDASYDYIKTLFMPLCGTYYMLFFLLSLTPIVVCFLLEGLNWFVCKEEERCSVKGKGYVSISFVLWLAIMVLTISYIRTEENVYARKDFFAKNHTMNQEWKEVLKSMEGQKKITKIQNAYRIIALYNTEGLGRLFDFPLPYKETSAMLPYDFFMTQTTELFYASQLSAAYNMNMEQWATYGFSYEGLQWFVIMSLLNGEDELAKRYIYVMKQTCLADLGEKYEKYVGNQDKFFKDYPFYRLVKERMNTKGEINTIRASDPVPLIFPKYDQLSVQCVENRLMAELYARNIDAFLNDLMVVQSVYPRLPQYFKEAIILKTMETHRPDWVQRFPIERQLVDRVSMLLNEASKYLPKNKDKGAEALYPKYKNMYTYYYIFGKPIEKVVKEEMR